MPPMCPPGRQQAGGNVRNIGMGIGLVDPILPAISHQLHASPSEVTLLFTSYLVVTAVAMLITNWVSSRLGAKPHGPAAGYQPHGHGERARR